MDDRDGRPALFPALTRRGFLQGGLAAAALMATKGNPAGAAPPAHTAQSATSSGGARPVTLQINGQPYVLELDPRVTLLDALRDYAGLTGTKKGCDRGQCGACTVLVGKRRINACLTLATMHEGEPITTVEGLASGDSLSPLQQAFIDHDAFQCGFCTPGQLCSATALLGELAAHAPSAATPDVRAERIAPGEEELRERMSGNLCRCGAYPNIVEAIRDVADPAHRSTLKET